MKGLRWINLVGTRVTPDGIAALKKAKPELEVVR
jgi:hypothetical protein